MPISETQALTPLPDFRTPQAPVTAEFAPPRVQSVESPAAGAQRGVKTTEFWVSLMALAVPWLEGHFTPAATGSSASALGPAIVAAAYVAGRSYIKANKRL